ncbi:hypothetical protein N181_01030 [Sinorhizobium fredii USDA 205]|nr:hypothetical protein N181_01030 [Sinorhizobium fredii USDA 205]
MKKSARALKVEIWQGAFDHGSSASKYVEDIFGMTTPHIEEIKNTIIARCRVVSKVQHPPAKRCDL